MANVTRTQPSADTVQENFYMKLHSKIHFYFSSGNQEVLTDIKWIFINDMINYKHNL